MKKGPAARAQKAGAPSYSRSEMKRLLEAILFAADKPVSLGTLTQVLSGSPEEAVRDALRDLGREYEETGRSFVLKEVGGGFILLTHPAYEPWVRKLFRGRLTLRLSRSALETVAIVAYRQPISKAEIETIRGVNADAVLNTLLERKLIRVAGRKPGMGRALLYGTTGDFLTYMGLNELEDLPQLEEMKAILSSHEQASETQAPAGGNGSAQPAETETAQSSEAAAGQQPEAAPEGTTGDGDPLNQDPAPPQDQPESEPDSGDETPPA